MYNRYYFRATTNDYSHFHLICWLFTWLTDEPFGLYSVIYSDTASQSPGCLQIACFVLTNSSNANSI